MDAMMSFLTSINIINDDIKTLDKNIHELEEKYQQYHDTLNYKTIEEACDLNIKYINKYQNKIKTKLSELKKEITCNVNYKYNKLIIYNKTVTDFITIMDRYKQIQNKHELHIKNNFSRQFMIINPGTTQTEIDSLIENVDIKSTQVFQQKLLDNRHNESIKALQCIKAKHSDILKIEEGINDLQQLFMDMAILVDTQQYHLDNIENNIIISSEYIEEGTDKLIDANKLVDKSRKKICCIIVIVLIIIIFLMMPLLSILIR
jgi:t-SNARE complex subunit (syntaxin)